MSEESKLAAADLVDDLAPLGDVTTKAMFGGNGVFCDGVMFVLIDREGTVYLRGDDETAAEFESLGSRRHQPMPYWTLPAEVGDDPDRLAQWASRSLDIARAAKK